MLNYQRVFDQRLIFSTYEGIGMMIDMTHVAMGRNQIMADFCQRWDGEHVLRESGHLLVYIITLDPTLGLRIVVEDFGF